MNIETVDEPVRVLAVFSAGQVDPVRFRWGGREFEIFSINGRWTDRQLGICMYCYSVQVGDETYYLRFSSDDLQWWLDQVIVD